FATVLTALGIPVTLVSHDAHLLPSMDRELVDLMSAEFERRGVRLVLGAGLERVTRRGARLELQLSTDETLDCGAVLFAAGRTANANDLGLAEVGVALD